jgi:RNA polymerase sigma factor for flagellar operon FliA
MSAGLMALVQAAQAFDPDRGTSFAGYAATRIRGAIVDELRGLDWASRSVRRLARRVDDARTQLSVTLGRPATDAELAAALGIGLDELDSHREDLSRAVVMSLQGFDDSTIDDVLPASGITPAEALEQRERIAYLHDAVQQLPERLRLVVEGYFFQERPMLEIAAELGVTESRISQLRAEAVTLLRGALNAALDPDLLVPHERPDGCAARRKEAYYASVAAHRTFTARLASLAPQPFSA